MPSEKLREGDLVNINEVVVIKMMKMSQKKWHQQENLHIKGTLGYIIFHDIENTHNKILEADPNLGAW